MVQTVPVNKAALSSCLKAALFLRCVGIRNIQQGGYWMFKGACRLDDLAHRHIIFIFPALVKLFFWRSPPLFNLFAIASSFIRAKFHYGMAALTHVGKTTGVLAPISSCLSGMAYSNCGNFD